MINPSDCLAVDTDRVAGEVIDGEAIIINLVTGVYYSMQGIGGEIWSMIDAHRTVDSMVEEVAAHYDVAADDARRDLDAVLDQLMDEGLIQLCGNGHGTHAVHGGAARKPYQRPVLQVYRDMQDLLALDPPAPGMHQIAWNRSGNPSSK